MENEGAVLAVNFMQNLAFNARGGNNANPHMHDVVNEDMIGSDDKEENLFDLF